MHWHPDPQQINKVTPYLELWCTGIQHQTGEAFFPKVFCHIARWQLFKPQMMYITPPVSTKHVPSRNMFYACLIIINNIETQKGLAMIKGAAMRMRLIVKPSYYNTSASTKALMVQNLYQAWLPCCLMKYKLPWEWELIPEYWANRCLFVCLFVPYKQGWGICVIVFFYILCCKNTVKWCNKYKPKQCFLCVPYKQGWGICIIFFFYISCCKNSKMV